MFGTVRLLKNIITVLTGVVHAFSVTRTTSKILFLSDNQKVRVSELILFSMVK